MQQLLVIDKEELQSLISESVFQSVQSAIETLNANNTLSKEPEPDQTDLITRTEATKLLHISLPTLREWT